MFIAARNRTATKFQRNEIDDATDSRVIRAYFSVDAQPSDASVGINIQSQVRDNRIAFNIEKIVCVASEFGFLQNFGPTAVRHIVIADAGLDRYVRRKIPGEETRIDVDAVHDARDA